MDAQGYCLSMYGETNAFLYVLVCVCVSVCSYRIAILWQVLQATVGHTSPLPLFNP